MPLSIGFHHETQPRGSLGSRTQKTTASGITSTLQKQCCTTTTSIVGKTRAAKSHTSTSPHTTQLFCAVFTPFLPRFDPHITPAVQFLPRFYPPHHLTFTPFLPHILPRRLPRFYPVFTLFRRVKSRVYPKFTPVPRFLPHQAFYPNFSTYTPFLPQIYPRGKTGLF